MARLIAPSSAGASSGRALNSREAEDLFAGALLQDMAIPLLLKELPEQYESLLSRRVLESRRLSGWSKNFLAGTTPMQQRC